MTESSQAGIFEEFLGKEVSVVFSSEHEETLIQGILLTESHKFILVAAGLHDHHIRIADIIQMKLSDDLRFPL